ncbi:MAG: MerR family transcriptional regulator [SAR86 cluster bacterium]|uniref:MerR family transcriptional regulator n=1 Tax=SAR86 cluster bacterium TaxID=2030880 RepID=A0A2A5B7H0_9GAMM|nr:MAG: MerR family transcriptional regulator [SAR86 cluster bacterium]
MLISEFSRETGVSVDTIRFYIKRGILTPRLGQQGGSNPYQIFSNNDLDDIESVRVCQALGMTLNEIQKLITDNRAGTISKEEMSSRVEHRRDQLLERKEEINVLINFLNAKQAWIQGAPGASQPRLNFSQSHNKAENII